MKGFAVSRDEVTYYVVVPTHGGGIFLSDLWDPERTWSRGGGLTSYFVTSVAVTPMAMRVLYAGVEAREGHIPPASQSQLVKSTDGGLTWFESSAGIRNDANGRSIPLAVAVSTSDPNVVYAGCSSLGPGPTLPPRFYRSIDAGFSWAAADTGHPGISYAVAVHPDSGHVLLSGSDSGVYRSVDGARRWAFSAIPGGRVKAVLFVPEAPQVALAGNDLGIHRSTNGGATWSRVAPPWGPDSLVTCLTADRYENRYLYAGTERDGVFESYDLGETWQQPGGSEPLLPSITSLILLDPDCPWRVHAGTAFCGVYRSPYPADWIWASDGLRASVARCCLVLSDGSVLAGIEQLGAAQSADGLLWSYRPYIGSGETILSFCAHPVSPDTVYAGSSSGVLYASSSRGLVWHSLHTFPGPVNGIGVDHQAPTRMYATVAGDSFYVSDDAGITWHGHWFGEAAYRGVAVNPEDGSHLLVPVVAQGARLVHGIFQSDDGGETWTQRADCCPTNIAFDPADTSLVYSGQDGEGGLRRSTDGGATWASLTEFPAGNGWTQVAVDDSSGDVWASKTGYGVFLSVDHGTSWADVSGGMVNRVISWIDVGRAEGGCRVIAVATEGAGMHVAIVAALGSEVAGGEEQSEEQPAKQDPRALRVTATPNPSSAQVALRLEAAEPGRARIEVLDVSGRLVRSLVAGEPNAGEAVWDGRDAGGRPVAPGIYLVRAQLGASAATGKLVRTR